MAQPSPQPSPIPNLLADAAASMRGLLLQYFNELAASTSDPGARKQKWLTQSQRERFQNRETPDEDLAEKETGIVVFAFLISRTRTTESGVRSFLVKACVRACVRASFTACIFYSRGACRVELFCAAPGLCESLSIMLQPACCEPG